MAFSDSDSDEGMDTEDYKEYEPPPIDISKCHVYTITQTNQWEEGNAVPTNAWHNIAQKKGAVHQNVTNNEYNIGKKIIENKNNTENTKIKTKPVVDLNQIKGCLQISEKSSHIYDIIKEHNQFLTTFSENSRKKMQELKKKFKSTYYPHLSTTGPLRVSGKVLVKALVLAFLFDIDVQESTIDMFQITTRKYTGVMLKHLEKHFRKMMTQIKISPDNVLFSEYYQKLERLVLQRYKEVHQPCLNGRLSRPVTPIDMVQNQVEKDVNSITKQGIQNQVSECLLGDIKFPEDPLQLSSECVEIYLGIIEEHSQRSSTSKSQKQDSPLISEKIQMNLERSFLRAKPSSDNSVYTRIRELVRAITLALLFGINVSKSFIEALKTNMLPIEVEPLLLKIEVRKHFQELMELLQAPFENPMLFNLYTKLEDLIIQRDVHYVQSSSLLHSNFENTKNNTEVSRIGKINIKESVQKRISKLNFLKANLNLSKTAAQIYIIIRLENKFVCHKNRIFSAISEAHRKLLEKLYYQIAGKTTFHPRGLPSELLVKDLVRAVSVALLFEIDIENSIIPFCKYEGDLVSLKREIKLHFKHLMTSLTILPNDQIYCLLYRKVEKLLIPDKKNFNCVPSVLQVHTNRPGYLTSYIVHSRPYTEFKSTGPLDNYAKKFSVLSETSRKSHRTQLIDNTQEREAANLNLANSVAHSDTELNVTNRVLVPSTVAVPKEEKKRKGNSKKGNESNNLQKLLLSDINQVTTSTKIELKNTQSNEEIVLPNNHSSEAVNQVLTSREIELKNTESRENMVLPNHHSTEADSVNKNCTTEESDIIGTDDRSSISDTQQGQIISERNKSTVIQPTVIESQSMSNTQRENNMENGYNIKHSDHLNYSSHSVTEANIDQSEHHSTNDIVLRLDIQTPSAYSLQDQQVDISTDVTDHTSELNTSPEEFLPRIFHGEEMVRSAYNALVPSTNCDSIEPEDLLNRVRYLLILYFSIVLGISFLDWVLTNAFSILMVILVVLFVK
ncbi:uncharacterized protein LOC114333841 isoform X2 [Diabrotica virgifera virgifera]|nr:uncharacterized protein LOC114333841 isoform X2 [Diabrotica virgifera virgifera]